VWKFQQSWHLYCKTPYPTLAIPAWHEVSDSPSSIYIYHVPRNCHPATVTQVLKSEVMSCLTHPNELSSMIYPLLPNCPLCLMAATDPVRQDISVLQQHG